MYVYIDSFERSCTNWDMGLRLWVQGIQQLGAWEFSIHRSRRNTASRVLVLGHVG